jgi:hypothetical protein
MCRAVIESQTSAAVKTADRSSWDFLSSISGSPNGNALSEVRSWKIMTASPSRAYPVRQMLLATATIIGLQFALSCEAQDIESPPVSIYEGTFEGPSITGSIKLFADFKARSISADMMIPSFQFGSVTLPPEHFRPSGPIIDKDGPASYTLTQGVAYSPEPQAARKTQKRQSHSPYILLTGSFWGPGASTRETSGTFVATFCVPETHCSEMSSVAGTYSARAIR